MIVIICNNPASCIALTTKFVSSFMDAGKKYQVSVNINKNVAMVFVIIPDYLNWMYHRMDAIIRYESLINLIKRDIHNNPSLYPLLL